MVVYFPNMKIVWVMFSQIFPAKNLPNQWEILNLYQDISVKISCVKRRYSNNSNNIERISILHYGNSFLSDSVEKAKFPRSFLFMHLPLKSVILLRERRIWYSYRIYSLHLNSIKSAICFWDVWVGGLNVCECVRTLEMCYYLLW